MANKQNIRTKQAIISAFLKILEKKSFDRIVIQDILDETPVSRSTFYSYFHDKNEIAEYLESSVLSAIEELGYIFVFFDSHQNEDIPPILFETFRQYRPIVNALLKIHTDRVDLIGKLSTNIRKNYILSYRSSDKEFIETEADMYADIFARFIIYTLTKDTVSPDSLMKDFRTMYTNVFMRLLTLDEKSEQKIRKEIDSSVLRDHKKFIEREKKQNPLPENNR